MASSSSTTDLVKRVAKLLKQIPDAEQEVLLAGWTQETPGIVQTEAGKETEEEGSVASQVRKRKASFQGEEGSGKKATLVTLSDS